MPYILLQVGGKLTNEQKTQIAKEFSDTLLRVANKPKKATYLVFEEVSRDNWAIGDYLLSSTK
jgi:4-oxalocrotonate tautomerase